MPKTRPTFAFAETTDDVARKTYKTPDEKEYVRESRCKKVKLGDQPIPVTGSCCDRCRNCRPAMEGEAYGLCRQLGVVLERTPFHEKGEIIDRLTNHGVVSEPLHCKPWAGQGCSGYVDVAEEAAA
ncbi:MAG: hypothetical protein ACR2OE_04135 [Thermomicrobiales bacterium]